MLNLRTIEIGACILRFPNKLHNSAVVLSSFFQRPISDIFYVTLSKRIDVPFIKSFDHHFTISLKSRPALMQKKVSPVRILCIIQFEKKKQFEFEKSDFEKLI